MSNCYQFKIRERNLATDLLMLGLTEDDRAALRTDDFSFRVLEDKSDRDVARAFIRKYEWLGNVGQLPLYFFASYYGDKLGGVILMATPNNKHHLLGSDENNELLISRGACASWTPKNLASNFLMQCVDWCVENTQYRVFTSYADTEADEIGTIYQACRFYYLGGNFGATKEIKNPYSGEWVSERGLRRFSMYQNHAKRLKIKWEPSWMHPEHPRKILWENMPPEFVRLLKEPHFTIESRPVTPKHKYVFMKGKDRRETKQLRKRFEAHTKTYPYPKRQKL